MFIDKYRRDCRHLPDCGPDIFLSALSQRTQSRYGSIRRLQQSSESRTLSMGTDIGGGATPIGASANVVGIATASREGYVIKWGLYCRKMMPENP